MSCVVVKPSATAAKPQSAKKVFFPNPHGLRFWEFFLVYLQHSSGEGYYFGKGDGILYTSFISGIFKSGWAGVSFFFMLSGFLITYLILSEIRLKGKVDVLAFYIRRVLRIWPLYYALLLFSFILYPAMKSVFGFSSYIETGNPLYYIFFLGNFDVINLGEGRGEMSINITWLVAIEEQFYLMWPLLFFFILQRLYKYIFPVIVTVSAAFRLVYINYPMVLYFHSLMDFICCTL